MRLSSCLKNIFSLVSTGAQEVEGDLKVTVMHLKAVCQLTLNKKRRKTMLFIKAQLKLRYNIQMT